MNNAFKKRCVDITHLVGLQVAIAVESFLSRIVFLIVRNQRGLVVDCAAHAGSRPTVHTGEHRAYLRAALCGDVRVPVVLHGATAALCRQQLAAVAAGSATHLLLLTAVDHSDHDAEVRPRVGDDWLCVPVSAIAFASNVLMWRYPHNLAAVSVAICATCTSLCPTVLRSLVYRHFAESGEWQRQRALRIFTLSDTFGYATAPFIGGVLYDHGGLRACAGFALMTSALWACCCRSA